jgi:penicillin-binding protein 2
VVSHRFSFENLLGRYRLLLGVTILLFAAVLVRLVELQVVRGVSYREKAEENRIRPEVLRAHRGHLFDRYGRLLADNVPAFHLLFDPRDRSFRNDRQRLEEVVTDLAQILDRAPEELLETVRRARRAGRPPVTIARSLDFPTLSVLEERMEHLPGVEVRPQPARRYPYGHVAAHLLGYLGEVSAEEVARRSGGGERRYRLGDLVGRTGVERTYEAYLRGTDGIEFVEVDALGRRTHLFGELPAVAPIPGSDVLLTIDLDLQLAAEAALDSVGAFVEGTSAEEDGPRPGSVVAIDPRSGEVLAMVSRPSFDPNLFVGGLSSEDWKELSGSGHPLLNRAIQSAYPPGSTFKAVTALAGLHEGILGPDVLMPHRCLGRFPFGNRDFRCWKREGHGRLNLTEAIIRSCDIFFYQVGIGVGTERMMDYAVACSIGAPTRIDLPQERRSLVPTVDWYRRERGGPPVPGAALNLSIGQGELLLTPIALARLAAAVANGGTIRRPYVVASVTDRDGNALPIADNTGVVGQLPATGQELMLVREALEGVVMDEAGTGRRARVEPFRVAGKTGTAQNPHGEDHALFFGYAPAEEAEIVVVVVVEQSGHGGAVAAPVARSVLAAYLDPGAKPLLAGEER